LQPCLLCTERNFFNRKTIDFSVNMVKIFFAGLPPRTPVRTHTPVSRYTSPTPRGYVSSRSKTWKKSWVLIRSLILGSSTGRILYSLRLGIHGSAFTARRSRLGMHGSAFTARHSRHTTFTQQKVHLHPRQSNDADSVQPAATEKQKNSAV
jgi:hypothetical protein